MNRQRLQGLWMLLGSKRLFGTLTAILTLLSLTSTSALMAKAEEVSPVTQATLVDASADTTSAALGKTADTSATAVATTATFEVLVTADGVTQEMNVLGGTVEDILSALNVTVGEDDRISVKPETKIEKDLAVRVSRVTYKESVRTETLAYRTVTQTDSKLSNGTTKVKRAGKNGQQKVTVRETYVDGKLTDSDVIATEVTAEPVNKVVVKGTRRVASQTVTVGGGIQLQLDAKGQPINYKKLHTGKATAYTATEGKRTASGRPAQVGVVAVDPSVIPYGTKLYIVSPDGRWVYGYAVAGDTGGALRAGHVVVDLFYDTVAECYQFGRRTMNVYVIG